MLRTLIFLFSSLCCLAPCFGSETLDIDQLEQLNTADPQRAALKIAGLDRRILSIETLEVLGQVYVDVSDESSYLETLAQVTPTADTKDEAAVRAYHFLRGYFAYRHNEYAAASSELRTIVSVETGSYLEQYRIWSFLGAALRRQGQTEAARPYLERALNLATGNNDKWRRMHAIMSLAHLELDQGDLKVAALQFNVARDLALELKDEAALVVIEDRVAVMAEAQGDFASELQNRLLALAHAETLGSSKWLAHAMAGVSDSYLKTHDYRKALSFSRQAQPLAQTLPGSEESLLLRFNEGIALIGLGQRHAGERIVEETVSSALSSERGIEAREMLHEYAETLRRSGRWTKSIAVFTRYDRLTDQLMAQSRQQAFELAAQVDQERKEHEITQLHVEAALKVSELQEQQLHQQRTFLVAVFALCLSAALLWAFTWGRRANERLRIASEQDLLTGLGNRRFFHEHVLKAEGDRPMIGCVLLADLDHFKRINDTWGHPAGDAVLSAVSARLSTEVRKSDRLVRWGGEEFLAVLDAVTEEQASRTVERLLEAVRREPVQWKSQSINCTISIGYACFPLAEGVPIALEGAISIADRALYEAKRRGRDRAFLATSHLPTDADVLIFKLPDSEAQAAMA